MQKLFVFGFLLLGSVLGHPTVNENSGKTVTFSQRVDHFSDDASRFDMKYSVYDQYFQPGGPIIISLSRRPGHGISDSLFEEIASETNGYFIESDTRLFQNKSDFELKSITVDQILADFAAIIENAKATVPGLVNSKVIFIGRYDRGAIASWFRQKYPQYCNGAWAAEAAVEAKMTAEEYLEAVGGMIKRHGSSECYERIHTAFENIKNKFAQNQGNTLKEQFELCKDFKNANDEASFFTAILDLFSYHPRWSPRTIKPACEKMTDNSMDEVAAFAEMMKQYRTNSPFSTCLPNTYEDILQYYQTQGKNSFYVMCNELGSFKTTTSSTHPFSANLNAEWYSKICSDVFGSGFSYNEILKKIEDFNKRFGGKHPNVTNVYYTTGEYSPFKSQAITEDLGESVLAYVVQGMERAFVFSSSTDDSVSADLRQAQLRGMEQIRKWLK